MRAHITRQGVRQATPGDWPAIERLLSDRDLPAAGARAHLGTFLVAAEGSLVVGCAGIERYGDVGLLRSVAVAKTLAKHGLGAKLVTALLETARGLGLRALYLLTTTAAGYFPRFGFETIPRDALPASLAASEELRGTCPASAVAMRLIL
ncbi:MAG TPA: arsenic resistance N-acetyltransferase ArsN2 [Myxococcaceae bacterium]|nr:arsenic resistance N-acetyltransferase ArsN2 [Myxococcaceae bacterium]